MFLERREEKQYIVSHQSPLNSSQISYFFPPCKTRNMASNIAKERMKKIKSQKVQPWTTKQMAL
jgi:hypothetical protein